MAMENLWFILSLGTGLGMLHALDSDHLLTLANYNPVRSSLRQSIGFCSRWAIGHGAAIVIIGVAVLVFKLAIPFTLAAVAEHVVGVILIVLGMLALIHSTKALVVNQQSHDGGASLDTHGMLTSWRQQRIIGIGFLHGTSGSAALLALLPITQLPTPWLGMAYLLCFSLGVLVAMLIFGGILGTVFRRLGQRYFKLLAVLRVLIAIPAIVIGFLMVVQSA
jgi:nickel/cobalt transporter (NicO) family protein